MPVDIGDIRVVAATDDVLGEVPLWDRRAGALYWVDLLKPAVHRVNGSKGGLESWTPPEKLGAIALCEQDGLLIAGRSGVAWWDPQTGRRSSIANPESDRPGNIMNDGRVDARGRFLFGSMDRQLAGPHGRLWSLPSDGVATLLHEGDIMVPNGLCWSPDNKTLYFGDGRGEKIFAFDYDIDSGAVANRRVLADTAKLGGILDGISVDVDGYLWHARFGAGRIVRFDPQGRVDQIVEVPFPQPTHVTFGGPDLKTLFVTSARFRLPAERLVELEHPGALFAFDVGVAGLPENRFDDSRIRKGL